MNEVWLSCFRLFLALLFLSIPTSALPLPCSEAFSLLTDNESHWLAIPRNRAKEIRETIGTLRITPENIHSLFSHGYHQEKGASWRAKGLAYVDSQGETHVVFWPTGEQSRANEIHHRDVLARLLRLDAKSMRTRANHLPDARVEEAMLLLDNADLYDHWASDISSIRTQQSFPLELLTRVQGFRFVAGPLPSDRGGLTIRDFQVDSSITATQMGKGAFLDSTLQTRAILAVHEAIDPRIRGYVRQGSSGTGFGKVRINGFSRMPQTMQEAISSRLRENGLYPIDLDPADRIHGF